MLKNYLEEKKLSMYKVSKEGGIPYSTLNDLVNGRVEIENCKVSLLLQLSEYLGLSLDEIYAVVKTGSIPDEIPKAVEVSASGQNIESELQAPANDSDTAS